MISIRSRTRRRTDRGLVTVELALSLFAVIIVLAVVSWGMSLILVQLACMDTASAVARQAARGDRKGVATAEAARPPHAEVTVRHSPGRVTVEVRTRSTPPGGFGPAVTLSAEATAVPEPGSGS